MEVALHDSLRRIFHEFFSCHFVYFVEKKHVHLTYYKIQDTGISEIV